MYFEYTILFKNCEALFTIIFYFLFSFLYIFYKNIRIEYAIKTIRFRVCQKNYYIAFSYKTFIIRLYDIRVKRLGNVSSLTLGCMYQLGAISF